MDAISVSPGDGFQRAVGLLGGEKTLKRSITSPLQAHKLIEEGLPAAALTALVGHVDRVPFTTLARVVGVSLRTLQRRKAEGGQRLLSADQSGRTWRFAEVFAHAIDVFGSQDAAEQWLDQPDMALDQNRPIDLLSTPMGSKLVEDHLTRIEFGVYT